MDPKQIGSHCMVRSIIGDAIQDRVFSPRGAKPVLFSGAPFRGQNYSKNHAYRVIPQFVNISTMYLHAKHAEYDQDVLADLIRQNPLGVLITAIEHPDIQTIQFSHIPFVLDQREDGKVVLRGHIARVNPQAKAMRSTIEIDGRLGKEVVVMFQAPTQQYVTPKFYTTTKPDTGKVVPTWNYIAVQAYGKLTLHHEGLESAAFLQKQVEDLSLAQETAAGYGDRPWKVSDAPDRYIELLKKAIWGFEIEITSLAGRFKLSQEMQAGDRAGVVEGFKSLNTDEGSQMAKAVAERDGSTLV